MREQQRNHKNASQLSRYKPVLDTLEDRSMPGNALIGLTGFSMPFAFASAHKALSTQAANAGNIAVTKSKITSQTSVAISPSKSISSLIYAGKQALQSGIASSSTPTIQGGSSSTPMTFSSSARDSWESILNRAAGASSNPATSTVASPGFISAGASSTIQLAAASATPSSGGTATSAASQPVYDAETRARLYEFAHAGTQSYVEGDGAALEGLSATQLAAADAIKAQVPNLHYQTNTEFGIPTSIMNMTGMLTGPQAGDPVTIARNYLTQIAAFLGVQQSDINSLAVAKSYGETVGTTGVKLNYVYMHQQVSGIPVHGATTSVTMKADGQIGIVGNSMIPNVLASVNTTTPTVTAAAAAQAIAQNLGLSVTAPIVQRTAPVGAQQKGTVSTGGFARQDINTQLVFMPTGSGTRLAWHALVYLKNDYLFEFFVDANNGNVLKRNSLTDFASYRVLPVPVKAPNQGSFSVVTNPADKVASPWGWHDTNGKVGSEYTITSGNNVAARARRNSQAPGSLGYLYPSGGATNTYNYAANFKNDPVTYQAAAAVQLFYDVNTWHDVSYRYGFTEVAGNAQQNNYGRGLPIGFNDAIQAFAQDDAELGAANNAFMSTPPDGFKPEVHMFIFNLTGPNRDGDFDSAIVYHELGHALVGRLVNGGGQIGGVLSGPQAGAMNEGSGDFNGLWFTTGASDALKFNAATPDATWALGQPINGLGFRRFAYSTNEEINPLTYNDFDPAQIDVQFPPNPPFNPSFAPPDEVHNAGEIWTNALWEMTSNLVTKHGFSTNFHTGTAGNNRAYQLFISGLKMTPAFPSFLDARDAIIAANNMLYGGADLLQLWTAFADSGMGVHAEPGVFDLDADDPGWQGFGMMEDFTIPDDLPGGGDPDPDPDPDPGIGGDGSEDALYEPNQSSNTAFNLGSLTGENEVNNLQIKQNLPGQAADRDWFKFKPTAFGSMTITMTPNTTAGDLDVRLYRSTNGSPSALTEIGITQGTHRVAGGVETITVAVGAGITYYLVVQGFAGGLGNYNLTLDAPG